MIKKILHYKKRYEQLRKYVEYLLNLEEGLLLNTAEFDAKYEETETSRMLKDSHTSKIIILKQILHAMEYYEETL